MLTVRWRNWKKRPGQKALLLCIIGVPWMVSGSNSERLFYLFVAAPFDFFAEWEDRSGGKKD